MSNLTLSSSCSPEMVDGPEDEPEGPLLVTADPQNLHGCLQLGELLGGPLLILSLAVTHTHKKFLFELLKIKNFFYYQPKKLIIYAEFRQSC